MVFFFFFIIYVFFVRVFDLQAIQVRLNKPTDELFTEKVIQFLVDLSVSEEDHSPTKFLLKTIKEGPNPVVDLYVRLPGDTKNELVTLNDIIGSYFPQYR